MHQGHLLLEGLHFGECPRWHDGRLWLADMWGLTVLAVTFDGQAEPVVEVPGRPGGLGWLPDGRLLVVAMTERKLLRLDPGGLVDHADLSSVASFECNDMVVDAQGRAYVGNFGFDLRAYAAEHSQAALFDEPGPPTATLARVDPDGTVGIATTGLRFPNGSVITPDGRTLIVAETFGRRLSAFDVGPDGTLGNRRIWAATGDGVPDGICLDSEGAVWVANAMAPECLRMAEGGVVLDRVATSQPCFACALGGTDGRTLFLMTAPTSGPANRTARKGRIEVAEVEVPSAEFPGGMQT